MCGIAGLWQPNRAPNVAKVQDVLTALQHRGPDDEGVWVDFNHGIVLGHKRLSVVDLSPAGKQPMKSFCGRFILTYNGEIYNHLEIRKRINEKFNSFQWVGSSDTETFLAAISLFGVVAAVNMAVGMFAFALWDRTLAELTLGRDRMGEKPLYYLQKGSSLFWSSELKGLKVSSEVNFDINKVALSEYFRRGYISAPQTIYKQVRKVLPGSLIKIGFNNEFSLVVKEYWCLGDYVEKSGSVFPRTIDGAAEELEILLCNSVKGQMMSDVPIGAFLSSGIDSSTIVAVMQSLSSNPIQTFSIGFHEASHNEADKARQIASHLGTDHTELVISEQDILQQALGLGEVLDEPFGDPSIFPTLLVSKLARSSVKVALSGDGGDELFGGYNRYRTLLRVHERLENYPEIFRHLAAKLYGLGAQVKFFGRANDYNYRSILLSASDAYDLYSAITDNLNPFECPILRSDSDYDDGFTLSYRRPFTDPADVAMYMDTLFYLPNDILHKVDAAAMSVSLETRVPMLDHRIVEWAWALPQTHRARSQVTKILLRKVLEKYIPLELIGGTKKGFGLPMDDWLRGGLRDWAEDLLDPQVMYRDGILNPVVVWRIWKQYIAGRSEARRYIWNILMFQNWHRSNIGVH